MENPVYKTPFDVFVAHSSDAKEFSRRVCARLRAARLRVFFDERELEEGTPYDPRIEDAIKSSTAFLFVISRSSVAAKAYALTELEWAVESKRKLFGVHAEGHDDVAPPAEIDALTLIASRGDRIARTVSVLRRGGRSRWRPVALALSVFVPMTAAVWFLREKPSLKYEVTVSGNILRNTETLPLATTRHFRSHDKFQLSISATQRVQMHVAYCDANRQLSVAPGSGKWLEPGQTVLMPNERYFFVDDVVGEETLYVVTSAVPLDDVDGALAGALQQGNSASKQLCAAELEMTTEQSLASSDHAEPQAEPARRRSEPEYRPRGLAVEGSGSSLRSRSDAHGVVVLALRRKHDR